MRHDQRASRPFARLPLAWRRRLGVFVGSVAGTGLRVAFGLLPHPPASWPWGTFVANVTGALVLGYLLTRLEAAASPTSMTLPVLCTGLLGSYTTFSTFVVETRWLLVADQPALAAGYAVTSVLFGYAAALAGVRLAEVRR